MQKAIRNTSGKPTTVENLDKRDAARQKPSANPNARDEAKLDRDREAVRIAQARAEQSKPDVTEFDVQDRK